MATKQLPKRAASRAQFIFWQLVAMAFVFTGVTIGGGAGIILFFGGFGMSLREMGLRRKWKKMQRENQASTEAQRDDAARAAWNAMTREQQAAAYQSITGKSL